MMYTVKTRVEAREDGFYQVYDVFDNEGECIYTGCDWATAEKYM